jgi:hypothetical protein
MESGGGLVRELCRRSELEEDERRLKFGGRESRCLLLGANGMKGRGEEEWINPRQADSLARRNKSIVN